MEHILDLKLQNEEIEPLFEAIYNGNAILFLGAGASVGDKKYLSKEIIDYYEEYLGKSINESNITKFVDILSASQGFRRTHFDQEVENMLHKYEVSQAHKILATIPWREILTTNFDLLVEKAYDEIRNTSNYICDLIPIRHLNEYNYRTGRDEVKYIKLNGCISDKSKYPLVFSTDDFNSRKTFYKTVLNDLKNLSTKICLISIGYSFSDNFGSELLDKFDSFNFRDKKWIYNIDPFPNEGALDYYKSKRICIIKSSFNDFFVEYSNWEKAINVSQLRKRASFTNGKKQRITVPTKLSLRLSSCIKQLNDKVSERYVKDLQFYMGEEPNYQLILRGVDVVKKEILTKAERTITQVINKNHSTIIPAFFVTGGFGIGKSTFTLRLIHELSKNLDLIAFEITDFLSLRKEYLVDLFSYCTAKNVVIFCDEVEVESSFKTLIDLRRELSIEQFNDFNLFFLVPIRENIYEKYRRKREISKAYDINIQGDLSIDEIKDLLEKLKSVNLINYRDTVERDRFVKKISSDFGSDSFVTLLSLVTNGSHINDLISAYNQLSPLAQKAFLYSAMLHRYKLSMPSSILKQLLSVDWDEFTNNVIRVEGKGILIQVSTNSSDADPDIYFRTKHPIIADELVKKLVPNKDKQYKYYEEIVNAITIGNRNSYLIINLLKILTQNGTYSKSKIDKLYDRGYTQLSDDPFYILNYCINLEKRCTEQDLKRALDLLIYAESLLQYRNHRFIHRRAVINFELAKKAFAKEDQLNYTYTYLDEAEELFVAKQLLDPFSIYSYENYIRMLIWELKKLNYEDEEQLQKRIQIEELFELGSNAVTEQISRLHNLKTQYATYLQKTINTVDFKGYLDNLYANHELRPYACILLYYFYSEKGNIEESIHYINEMREYLDNNEVAKFLFKYYGQNLHVAENRIRLFELGRSNAIIEKNNPLRYYYFNFMAESYNHNFHHGKEALTEIKTKYYGLNPEFHYIWKDVDGTEMIFEGKIIKKHRSKYKAVKITRLQQIFRLVKGNYEQYPIGNDVKIKLHFYLYGIMAEIVEDRSTRN